MTEFLVKHFVKDPEAITDHRVRTAYGSLTGGVGICLNLLLFLTKLLVGFIAHSVSVMADAFNNLSDAASSIISFVGVRLADKPADEEHPFGHGRIEYISAFIVAFLVVQVGFMLLKSAIGKILHPEDLQVSLLSLFILLISIGGKLWLSAFNEKLGRRIDSKVMLATAADARSDVLATSATVLSLLVFRFFGLNIDGVIGLIVSLLVLKAGYEIAKDTLEPLIGERMDPELCSEIRDFVRSYPDVLGTHDLIIHNYGPQKYIGSIHVEVDSHMTLEDSHILMDRIEDDAKEKLGILLVTHADPLDIHDPETASVRAIVDETIREEQDGNISAHDLRLVHGASGINAVFDLVLPWNYGEEQTRALILRIRKRVKEKDSKLNCIITPEHGFGG